MAAIRDPLRVTAATDALQILRKPTSAYIVRIMCAAYGSRAANGGAAQSDGVGEGIG